MIPDNYNHVPELVELCIRNAIGVKAVYQCGFQHISVKKHAKLMDDNDVNQAATLLPYYDIFGNQIDAFRTVSMETLPNKMRKLTYRQKGGLLDRVYFPPLLPWAEIAENSNTGIVIYEFELDAIRSCQHGIPAIADRGIKELEARRLSGLDAMIVEDLAPFIAEERKSYLAHWSGDLGTLVANPNWDDL